MRLVRPLSCSLALLACRLAMAQGFSSGSDGSFGPLNVPAGTVTLDVPPNGIFNATTVNVAQAGVLRFRPNARNTAVYILATGPIKIDGRILLDAGSGSATDGGAAGPGGFAGGKPGIGGSPPGAGNGPGAGGPGDTSNGASGAGNAAYGAAAGGASSRNGAVHGSPLVLPLLGGSGGGGAPGAGGGGGGGALLLASSLSVEVTASAQIAARGGNPSGGGATGYGSGGAIRIVAPAVFGQGELNVSAVAGGGPGRIRIDALDRSNARFAFQPSTPVVASSGSLMTVFPPNLPRLDVVEAAGQAIAEGAAGPVQVLLPAGSTRSRTVKVQGRNFTGKVPIQVTLTPESGESLVYTAEIDMTAGNPATVTVSVELPVNTVTRIFTWTR